MTDMDRALEFGSGYSTPCLCAYFKHVTSFDHDDKRCYQGDHDNLDLKIRPLVQYEGQDYEDALAHHQLDDLDTGHIFEGSITTSIKNAFYQIDPDDLRGYYDYVLLDGPFGNGRSLAFSAIYHHVKPGTILFIDDLMHHDFNWRVRRFWDLETIHFEVEDVHKSHGVFRIKGVN